MYKLSEVERCLEERTIRCKPQTLEDFRKNYLTRTGNDKKDDILKMTEKGISVFRYYLPVDFKVGKNFLNPFYKDTKASCNIYYERKAGVFKMKDFGNDDYSGDCFELVGRLNGLSCKEPKEFVEIME